VNRVCILAQEAGSGHDRTSERRPAGVPEAPARTGAVCAAEFDLVLQLACQLNGTRASPEPMTERDLVQQSSVVMFAQLRGSQIAPETPGLKTVSSAYVGSNPTAAATSETVAGSAVFSG
jgi:hypothetical protein